MNLIFNSDLFFIILKKDKDEEEMAEGISSFMTWLLGIGLLTFALFLSARMGIFQECLYSQYGKHPREALYYIVSMQYRSKYKYLK